MITIVLIGIVLYLLLLLLLYFFYNPIKFFDRLQRSILYITGFKYKQFDLKHKKIGYFEGGSGQPIILIHGFMLHAGNWSGIAPKLKKKNTVIIPDLPAHGNSPWPDSKSIEALGEGILEFLYGQTKDEPAVLIGHSMGGAIALRFALSYPERVKKLVLINAAGLRWHLDKDLLLPKDRSNALRKIHALMKSDLNPPGFILDAMIRETNFDFENLLRDAMTHEDYILNTQLNQLAVKPYVLWGEKDGLFSNSYMNRLLSLLPSYELKLFPDDAHVPHSTNPKATLEYLDEILNAE